MNNGWIKIHRKLLDWEWYDEPNTLRLFLHLLLKANHKPRNYRGVEIKAGEIMTGFDKLASELGLSVQQIRTSISKLKATSEITSVSNSKGTVIQLVKYKDYQVATSEATVKEQTDNKPITTNKNEKKEKNNKDLLRAALSELHKDKIEIYKKWALYRKSIKKSILVEQTIKTLVKRFNEEDINKVIYVVNTSIENGWQGLFWDKYDEKEHKPKRDVKVITANEFYNR